MKDLIINVPPEVKLIPAVKDAEACYICGGSRPELFWDGHGLAHITCVKDAKKARKVNGRPEKSISIDEFMNRLAGHPRLVDRMFGRESHNARTR